MDQRKKKMIIVCQESLEIFKEHSVSFSNFSTQYYINIRQYTDSV